MTGPGFDPRAILAGLQAAGVSGVVIGGLARVARGADEITTGVDICPSLQPANLDRLGVALTAMQAARRDGQQLILDEAHLRGEPVIELATAFGELKLIAVPTGVPRGYDALRAGASAEHLGNGLRPEIAGTGDLIAMSAALRRPADVTRLPHLRRILELEAEPARLVTSPPLTPTRLAPGAAMATERSYLDRTRRPGPSRGPRLGH
jgi:hypothetical protein